MADLSRIFDIGQRVNCRIDDRLYEGVVNEIYCDHIIVDIAEISNHCWFEEGINIGDVYPEYNYW